MAQPQQRVTLKQFHAQIMRLIIENLLEKGFKHVSVLPEGYQECHDLALQNDLDLVGHSNSVPLTQIKQFHQCYHCSSRRAMAARTHQSTVGVQLRHTTGAKLESTSPLTNSSRYLMLDDSKSPVSDQQQVVMATKDKNSMSGSGAFPAPDLRQDNVDQTYSQKFNLMDFSNLLPFMNKQVANVADKINRLWSVTANESEPDQQVPLP